MYSYPGPVSVVFRDHARQKRGVAVRSVSAPRLFSQPVHTVVYPRVHRKGIVEHCGIGKCAGSLCRSGCCFSV